ncbi:hypothetical protein HX878_20730 [Pseudomonas veronii]|uniref:hypothetical protein n=1 Tax=Pseudomonas veronii TaxID=76761 RepID=UPI0015A4CF2F|nr:hypothetical protein [Pseudomonas veronii]NWD57160.1 hypothetical protein [Pseudomonas veronii]
MSKLKATLRGKDGKHKATLDRRGLKLQLVRKVRKTTCTDIFLLETLFSKKETAEPVGPLAGKKRVHA